MNCDGYRKLVEAVERDERTQPGFHNYRAKLAFVIDRAKHYAEKTGLSPEAILDSWEQRRTYWYMNFYQECNQPRIEAGDVRVFKTRADLIEAIGKTGFRCPRCAGVSRSPYECNSCVEIEPGKMCDWKVYGLLGHLGKGVTVFVIEVVSMEQIFMPIAWELPVKAPSRTCEPVPSHASRRQCQP